MTAPQCCARLRSKKNHRDPKGSQPQNLGYVPALISTLKYLVAFYLTLCLFNFKAPPEYKKSTSGPPPLQWLKFQFPPLFSPFPPPPFEINNEWSLIFRFPLI